MRFRSCSSTRSLPGPAPRFTGPSPRTPGVGLRGATALAAILWSLGPASAAAQFPGPGPTLGDVPASTRAMALGDAYAMDSGHADALFYHPALLTGAAGMGLEIQRWDGSGQAVAASAAFAWFGGGVAIGLRTLEYGADSGGSPLAGGAQDDLFEPGPDPVAERAATIGYAREALFGFDVGVAIDLVRERAWGVGEQTETRVDVGVARDVGPVRMALTVADLGPVPVLGEGSAPPRVVLGAGAYGRPLGPLDVGFAAKVGWVDDEVVYGGGVELGYWPIQGRTFVARVGFQDVPEGSEALPLTTGFAFQGDDIVVEWAFRPFSEGTDEGGSHRFALRWR